MMIQLKTWQPMCDICRHLGPVMTAQYEPKPPLGWTRRTLTDCGMTGYTRREIICPDCTVRHADALAVVTS